MKEEEAQLNSNLQYSGPQLMRRDQKYSLVEDISRLRQRMLNLEETVKELKSVIEILKDK